MALQRLGGVRYVREIAEACGVSRRTVFRRLRELRALGLRPSIAPRGRPRLLRLDHGQIRRLTAPMPGLARSESGIFAAAVEWARLAWPQASAGSCAYAVRKSIDAGLAESELEDYWRNAPELRAIEVRTDTPWLAASARHRVAEWIRARRAAEAMRARQMARETAEAEKRAKERAQVSGDLPDPDELIRALQGPNWLEKIRQVGRTVDPE